MWCELFTNIFFYYGIILLCVFFSVSKLSRTYSVYSVSYKFVKGFLAITFLINYFFLAETYIMCVNIFYTTRDEISAASDKKMRIFPIDPHYKNRPLL